MDDIVDFVEKYIFEPFMCVLTVGIVLLCVVGVFCIPSCIKKDAEEKKQIEECFMQEPRTKECEFILWKHELKMSKPRNTHSTMVMPMVIR